MPQFKVLGAYAFQGEGDEGEVVGAFVKVYEGYQDALQLTQHTFGSSVVSLDTVNLASLKQADPGNWATPPGSMGGVWDAPGPKGTGVNKGKDLRPFCPGNSSP